MGQFRNRKSEVSCPFCGGNVTRVGGYPTLVDNKLMHRQYRKCLVCEKKIITYKSFETGDIFYKGQKIN